MLILRRLSTAYALVAFLDQDDPLPQQWRPVLGEQGRCPSRRTGERRLAALPQSLPGLMGCLGRHWVTRLRPWARHGRAGAGDSTPLATGGGVWHKQPRAPGVLPQSSIETAAGWSKSGWHGWWYGWQLPLAVTAGALWIPWAAELTVAHRGDNAAAPWLLEPWPEEGRYVLGDTHDNTPELRQECHQRGWALVATRRGPSPRRAGGAAVRQGFHQRRSKAMEPFHGLLKNSCAWRVHMPVKGLPRSQWLALGAVVIEQLVLLYQHERHLPVGKGIKPLLRAA